jgi:beta-lactamase regulating signal transducer with metallopeptidase domain
LPGNVDATTGIQGDSGITWNIPMDGSKIDVATSTTNVDVASSISRVAKVLLLGLLVLWIAGTLILLMLVANARQRRSLRR